MNQRELILVKLYELFDTADFIAKVVRQRPTETTFKSLPNSSFPYGVLEASAPQFKKQVQGARKGFSPTVLFEFELPVNIMIYDRLVDEVDTAFGVMYNKVFALLFTDPSFYGLATSIDIDPEAHALLDLRPYYAFRMKIVFTYKTSGGI